LLGLSRVVTNWKQTLALMSAEFGQEAVNLWLKPLITRTQGQTLYVYASNPLVLGTVQAKFASRLSTHCLAQQPPLQLKLLLGSGSDFGASDGDNQTQPARSPEAHVPRMPIATQLDERYVFENFVEGSSNRLARLTALQVAGAPGANNHNPLVLYGGTGLGKTHLLHAAGNLMRQSKPDARILYVRSEDFVSNLMKALRGTNRDQGMDAFKARYRELDCLLIDDIQFFASKNGTQEEFFHTFNALYDSRQQIIMTCDRFPKELENFEQRLQSRFGWGLSVAVEPPDFETRVQILLTKAEAANIPLHENVAQLIAKRMPGNVRELEGALNTLIARAHFSGDSISEDFTQETLRDLFRVQDRSVSVGSIQKAVAEYSRVSLSDLLSAKRTRSIARARQLAMALTKELTTLSLKEIGLAFGGRDHTTVMHACKLIDELKRTEGAIFEDWQTMQRKLVG
jgi:chromosomal replication initiator protein